MGGSGRSMTNSNTSLVSMRFVGFNVSVFLTFALGYLLLILLMVFLSVGGSTTTTTGYGAGSGLLGGSVVLVFGMSIVLAPFIALVTGLFTGIGTNGTATAATTGLLGSGLGFVVLTVLVVVLGGIFVGGGLDGLGSAIPMLGGMVLATGVTGSVSAAVSNHYQ